MAAPKAPTAGTAILSTPAEEEAEDAALDALLPAALAAVLAALEASELALLTLEFTLAEILLSSEEREDRILASVAVAYSLE